MVPCSKKLIIILTGVILMTSLLTLLAGCFRKIAGGNGPETSGTSFTPPAVTMPAELRRIKLESSGGSMEYHSEFAIEVTPEEIVRGVAAYVPSGARMRVERLRDGRIVLNDSYNAGPQSMAAALRTLANTDAVRRIAMLGDMKELGAHTERGHREIGALVGELGIDTLLCVGEACRDFMAPEAKAAGCADVRWYEKKEDAYADLTAALCPNAAVLLKASHFSGRFDLIADYLREYPF